MVKHETLHQYALENRIHPRWSGKTNQEEHHRKKSFREEYLKMLNDYAVDYKEQYIFQDLQDG